MSSMAFSKYKWYGNGQVTLKLYKFQGAQIFCIGTVPEQTSQGGLFRPGIQLALPGLSQFCKSTSLCAEQAIEYILDSLTNVLSSSSSTSPQLQLGLNRRVFKELRHSYCINYAKQTHPLIGAYGVREQCLLQRILKTFSEVAFYLSTNSIPQPNQPHIVLSSYGVRFAWTPFLVDDNHTHTPLPTQAQIIPVQFGTSPFSPLFILPIIPPTYFQAN